LKYASKASCFWAQITPYDVNLDPTNNVDLKCSGDIDRYCQLLDFDLEIDLQYLANFKNNFQPKRLDQNDEIELIINTLPDDGSLFVSNSQLIRSLNQLEFNRINKAYLIGTNRGASGIDGILSTAAGWHYNQTTHLTVLIGDLACLYDLTSLQLLKKLNSTCRIIVFNNNGGKIFEKLPIGSSSYYDPYFRAPHGLTFEHASQMFGFDYQQLNNYYDLKKSLESRKISNQLVEYVS